MILVFRKGNSEAILLKGEKTMINVLPPLGILYMASILEKAKVEVSILDDAAEDMLIREVVDWVMNQNSFFEPEINVHSEGM